MDTDKTTPERVNITPTLSERRLNGGPIRKRFLTPCRRIGLGKSPVGSMKKSPQENLASSIKDHKLLFENKSSVINECKTPKSENIYKSKGRRTINNASKQTLVKCTDFVNKTSTHNNYGQLKSSEECNNLVEGTKLIEPSKLGSNLHSEITDETLTQLALKIKEKQIKVKDHGFQLISNDLLTLKESIDIWRKAAQSALQYLVNINKERGLPITLSELLQVHCFDAELLQFIPEEDDFL